MADLHISQVVWRTCFLQETTTEYGDCLLIGVCVVAGPPIRNEIAIQKKGDCDQRTAFRHLIG